MCRVGDLGRKFFQFAPGVSLIQSSWDTGERLQSMDAPNFEDEAIHGVEHGSFTVDGMTQRFCSCFFSPKISPLSVIHIPSLILITIISYERKKGTCNFTSLSPVNLRRSDDFKVDTSTY